MSNGKTLLRLKARAQLAWDLSRMAFAEGHEDESISHILAELIKTREETWKEAIELTEQIKENN